jgi:hypothetical protein
MTLFLEMGADLEVFAPNEASALSYFTAALYKTQRQYLTKSSSWSPGKPPSAQVLRFNLLSEVRRVCAAGCVARFALRQRCTDAGDGVG